MKLLAWRSVCFPWITQVQLSASLGNSCSTSQKSDVTSKAEGVWNEWRLSFSLLQLKVGHYAEGHAMFLGPKTLCSQEQAWLRRGMVKAFPWEGKGLHMFPGLFFHITGTSMSSLSCPLAESGCKYWDECAGLDPHALYREPVHWTLTAFSGSRYLSTSSCIPGRHGRIISENAEKNVKDLHLNE